MGYAKKRNRHATFEDRARDFLRDLGRKTISPAFKRVRFGRQKVFDVGLGQYRRLVRKRRPDHLRYTRHLEGKVLRYLKDGLITPEHYELVPVKGDVIDGQAVQEFFDKPTATQLMDFLKLKEPRIHWSKALAHRKYLSMEQVKVCKKLMGQNKGITADKVNDAVDELNRHLKLSSNSPRAFIVNLAYRQNVMVLGQTRDGKIRLALIDM